MELVNAFSTIVSNVGVPVACLAVTFYLWYTETRSHKEEITKLTEVLNNNTVAIQKLSDIVEQEMSKNEQ